jgi:hypothetical protein
MARLNNRQYSAAGSNYYGGGASAALGANVSAGLNGDVRWTGIAVLIALALVWIGYHGLKG